MIAVLIHYVEPTSGGYEQELRRACQVAANLHDFDLVFVCGGPIDDPNEEVRRTNRLYELIDDRYVDGAIVVAIGVCRHIGGAALFDRIPGLRRIPTCSIGMLIAGVPSVVADNDAGLAAAIEHLIVDHGRHNLAFLGARWSDVDINRRREVFLEVTARHGLSVPAHRMCECWLEPTSAEFTIGELLQLDSTVDAIVAANDGAAYGAIRALERLGLEVPTQVSVTGYDNLPTATLISPALTSVIQPLAAMSAAAVANVAAMLAGRTPEPVTQLASALVVRRSCGCAPKPIQAQPVELLAATARHAYTERLELENMYGHLLELGRALSVAQDIAHLEALVAEQLPKIHPGACFIGMFCGEAPTLMRSIVPHRVIEPGSTIHADLAFLSGLGSIEPPRATLVVGLTHPGELLGVAAFELSSYCVDYPSVASHLAGAWRVVMLREEVVAQTKLAERSAQERQAAADRGRATSVLASGVAHDLNNALGSLVSLTEVVSDELGEHFAKGRTLNADTIDDLQTIRSSALRATETIKDLMTLGRIGRTRQEPFDLVRLTRNVVENLSLLIAKQRTSPVSLELESVATSLIVSGSEPHVERAVGNVLRNAVEAARNGGRVKIVVSALQLEQPLHARESIPPGDYAVVTISDDGPGIDPESLRRVFEPFFSTKRLGESSGSGLGLAIVDNVIKEHHGYVDVRSQIGQGTHFGLYLPRVDVTPPVRPSAIPVTNGPARILVVDDDLTQLRTAKRVLTRCGYDVTTMASGARAFELVEMEIQEHHDVQSPVNASPEARNSSSFDLLIVDLALNETEDGLQIFRRIRGLFPGQKGILASGHAFVDREDEIREANLVWLPKPYTIESLMTAIRVALRDRALDGV